MIKKIVFSVGLAFSLLYATSSFAACDIDRSNNTYIEVTGSWLGKSYVQFDASSCPESFDPYHDGETHVKFELWLYGSLIGSQAFNTDRDNNQVKNLAWIFVWNYSESYNLRMFVDDDSSQRERWRQIHRINNVSMRN